MMINVNYGFIWFVKYYGIDIPYNLKKKHFIEDIPILTYERTVTESDGEKRIYMNVLQSEYTIRDNLTEYYNNSVKFNNKEIDHSYYLTPMTRVEVELNKNNIDLLNEAIRYITVECEYINVFDELYKEALRIRDTIICNAIELDAIGCDE